MRAPTNALIQNAEAYQRALQSAQDLRNELPELCSAEVGRRATQAVDTAEDNLHEALEQLALAGLTGPVPPLPLTAPRLYRRIEARQHAIQNMVNEGVGALDSASSASACRPPAVEDEEDALYEDLCLLSAMSGAEPPKVPVPTPARLKRDIAARSRDIQHTGFQIGQATMGYARIGGKGVSPEVQCLQQSLSDQQARLVALKDTLADLEQLPTVLRSVETNTIELQRLRQQHATKIASKDTATLPLLQTQIHSFERILHANLFRLSEIRKTPPPPYLQLSVFPNQDLSAGQGRQGRLLPGGRTSRPVTATAAPAPKVKAAAIVEVPPVPPGPASTPRAPWAGGTYIEGAPTTVRAAWAVGGIVTTHEVPFTQEGHPSHVDETKVIINAHTGKLIRVWADGVVPHW